MTNAIKVDESSLVELDPKCINCFGTSGKDKASIIKCFKIACLNYQSSKIKIPTG